MSPARIVAAHLLLTAAVVALVFHYHGEQKTAFENEIRNQLLTIADAKVRQISEWRNGRIADARLIMADRTTIAAAGRLIAGHGSGADRAALMEWLTAWEQRRGYANVILTGRNGRVVLFAGHDPGDVSHYRQEAEEVLRANDLDFRDFHLGPGGSQIHLGLNIPLRAAPNSPPVGAILIGIDPSDYLYPLIQSWPVPSKSAETLLVRRDGNEVVYLNELRHRRGTALKLRIPLDRAEIPAVRAAMGQEGFAKGLDYRAVPVLAVTRSIPGTPWFLIAKVDASEAGAPIWGLAVLIFGATSLILAAGLVALLIWRRRELRFYRERHRAQQALGASEALFQATFEQAAVGMAHVALDGGFLRVNQRFCDITSYSSDELQRLTFQAITHPDDLAADEAKARQLLDGAIETYSSEKRYIRKDGSTVWVNLTVSMLRSPSGQPVHYIGVIEDITRRKLSEEARERLEEQLLQARKLESVGRLAGGVAHDFNNHLTVINGYCDLILARLGSEDPLRGSLIQVRRAGEQSAQLTRQLLAFSRKQILKPVSVDLNSVIHDTRKMLERLIGESVELVTVLGPELHSITADPGQLNQVLMNLALNSRDAMPSGGKIIIETSNVNLDESYAVQHADVVPGAYVLLVVTDTGQGMDAETQRNIFEPFFTRKERGRGTGLGLATVYGIVRQTGGWIWVYSEPGRGSTFKIYFPATDRRPEPLPTSHALPAGPRGAETVLVVEDQENVRGLIIATLSEFGYQVLNAANGQQALTRSQEYTGPIHLLITDVVMPGMSGRELTGRLVELRPEMKVLFISGYSENVIAHQGVLDPGVAYLAKPFPPNRLSDKVREILDEGA